MNLRFLSVLAGLMLVSSLAMGQSNPPKRYNIIYIMSDDHAAHAISAYGSKVNKTPNIDRLATEGMRFDRCLVTNSICTPSRAVILTGKYSHLNGVPVFNRFDGSQQTVAKLMQKAGYYTGMLGKWHLGSDPTGFNFWNILPGQGSYFDPVLYDKTGARKYKGYVTDILTDMGIQFLKDRPKDKPFFLMLHHKAPHRNWIPDEKHRKQFAGKVIPEPETLWDDYTTRTDAIREQKQNISDLTSTDVKMPFPRGLKGKALTAWKYQRYMQDYLACIQSVDDNVGRLLDWMKANGLEENTVVIYTSDQGFFLGDHGLFDKRFMYEPSLKMPFLVRWPGVTKPGSTQEAIATNCDFAETFLDIAGAKIPSDMQGHSLVPLMKGEKPADWRTSMYYRYYHDPGHHNTRAHYGVCTETHKLIYFWKKNQWELYDLSKDPLEMHNIYNDPANKELVEKLKAEMYRLKKELKDEDQFSKKLPEDGVDGGPPKWAPGAKPKGKGEKPEHKVDI